MEEYFGEEYEDEEYLPFQEEEEGKNSLHYNLLDSKSYGSKLVSKEQSFCHNWLTKKVVWLFLFYKF